MRRSLASHRILIHSSWNDENENILTYGKVRNRDVMEMNSIFWKPKTKIKKLKNFDQQKMFVKLN